MGRTLIPRYLATLELSTIDDPKLHTLVANVAAAGKTSPIVLGSTTLQATIAALVTNDASLTTANKAVDADKNQLKLDISAEAQVRSLVVGGVRSVVTAVTNVAKSPADVTGAGLPAAPPRPPLNQAPTVPEQLDVSYPKGVHGVGKVTVYETGTTRHKFVAQQSPDGINWSALGVGQGKSRTLTGATGTKVWVRFAMVRGQQVSEWSAAVLVIFP